MTMMKRRLSSFHNLIIVAYAHVLQLSINNFSAGVSAFVTISSPQQQPSIVCTEVNNPVSWRRRQRRHGQGRVGWISSISSSSPPNAVNPETLQSDEYDDDDDDIMEDEDEYVTDEDEDLSYIAKAELWNEDGDVAVEDEAWMSDRERARARKSSMSTINAGQPESISSSPPTELVTSKEENEKDKNDANQQNDEQQQRRPSPYTDEEEDIINSMGGTAARVRKREPGFLGDSTLQDIAYDYSVPICYLADVLCMWGVPVPINIHDRLGDLVTGEQAFAILEAVYSLDVGALQDRYSNSNLITVCDMYDIPIKKAFDMALKEGWSLPFGVQTVLRVEQEEELLRVLRKDLE